MAEKNPHPDDDEDIGEYELEPIDPAILEHERKRADEKTRQAEASVDINEAYASADTPDPVGLDDLRSFRFTIRHLMIVTAVLAIMMSLVRLRGCLGFFVGGVAAVAAGWYFVLRKERRERKERQRRLEGLAPPLTTELPASSTEPSFASALSSLRLSFSLRQLFAALTVAAVGLGLTAALGGPEHMAILLGTIAILGLGIYVIGFEMPPIVILGWWLLLVLYIVVSVWAAFVTSGGP